MVSFNIWVEISTVLPERYPNAGPDFRGTEIKRVTKLENKKINTFKKGGNNIV